MYLNKESLYGNAKAKFILILDSADAKGAKLLRTVAKLYNKDNVNFHFVFYESCNTDLYKNFDRKNIAVTNAACDPNGWNNTNENSTNMRTLDLLESKVSAFKGVVCLDSLSPLLFHNDAIKVYKTVHRLLNTNSDLQLLAVLHHDVHDSYENEIIQKLASTVMVTVPNKDILNSVIHYSSGKVSSVLVEYKITDCFEFSILRDLQSSVKTLPVKKPDPTANLTFNLKLKDNEKEARSQLILPYMQMQNNDVVMMDNDMYDEEDPDDDLDI